MPLRQSRECLVEFRVLPHQYHPLWDERATFWPPMEQQRSTHIPWPRFISDNAYGEQPPIAIERDIREGLEPIQEDEPQTVEEDIIPTNQQDDINDMYSNAWFRSHMSNTVETADCIVPKQYQDFLKWSQDDQKDWQIAMQEEIKSLRNRKVWDVVDLPEGCIPIKGRWVYC